MFMTMQRIEQMTLFNIPDLVLNKKTLTTPSDPVLIKYSPFSPPKATLFTPPLDVFNPSKLCPGICKGPCASP